MSSHYITEEWCFGESRYNHFRFYSARLGPVEPDICLCVFWQWGAGMRILKTKSSVQDRPLFWQLATSLKIPPKDRETRVLSLGSASQDCPNLRGWRVMGCQYLWGAIGVELQKCQTKHRWDQTRQITTYTITIKVGIKIGLVETGSTTRIIIMILKARHARLRIKSKIRNVKIKRISNLCVYLSLSYRRFVVPSS